MVVIMRGHKYYRIIASVIAFIVLSVALPVFAKDHIPGGNGGLLTELGQFESGTVYKTSEDAYWVLSLYGSWREMGREYGGLVCEELRHFYEEISADIAARGMGHEEQLMNAKALASVFSPNLNELMEGIAETSGLTHDEVLILNAGMSLLSSLALGGAAPSACSGLAVWGEYTPDGDLIFGRNWDIERKSLAQYMKYLAVVVFNPDSENGFANVHPLGNVYLETGMNERGLFIELNNGMASDPNYIEDREDTVSALVTTLSQCDTVDEAAEYLVATPADLSHILQIADGTECVSVERATFGARVRAADQNGVLAAYNNFVPPYPEDWKSKVVDPPSAVDDPRYVNLLNLANSKEFFGKLDINGMKRLMGIEIQDGGAVHRGTVYQVIALPSQLTLWIRALDYSDWQEIDLRDLF
jgi:hypothetical protein